MQDLFFKDDCENEQESRSERLLPGKLNITVFQALTLLAQKYRHDKNNKESFRKVKKLYLSGVRTLSDLEQLNTLLQDTSLVDYSMSSTESDINEDPVRRYFESQLAYETLKSSIKMLDFSKLRRHYEALITQQPLNHLEIDEINRSWAKRKSAILNSCTKDDSIFDKSKSNKKTYLLFKIHTWSAGASIEHASSLSGYADYLFNVRHRGRKTTNTPTNKLKNRLGIMKPSMPLEENDLLHINGYEINNFVDKFTYIQAAQQPRIAFANLVTPFVGSSSGCLLRQLSVIERLHTQSMFVYSADERQIKNYFKCLIAFGVYFLGNHSFNEFVTILQSPEVIFVFKSIPGFSFMTLDKLFRDDNQDAFIKAVDKTITYYRLISHQHVGNNLFIVNTPNTPLVISLDHFMKECLSNDSVITEIGYLILSPRLSDGFFYTNKTLLWAALNGDNQLLQFLIAFGIDVNASSVTHFKLLKSTVFNALDLALCAGNVISAKILIEAGARTSYTDSMIKDETLNKMIVNEDSKAIQLLSKNLCDQIIRELKPSITLEYTLGYTGKFFNSSSACDEEEIGGMNLCAIC